MSANRLGAVPDAMSCCPAPSRYGNAAEKPTDEVLALQVCGMCVWCEYWCASCCLNAMHCATVWPGCAVAVQCGMPAHSCVAPLRNRGESSWGWPSRLNKPPLLFVRLPVCPAGHGGVCGVWLNICILPCSLMYICLPVCVAGHGGVCGVRCSRARDPGAGSEGQVAVSTLAELSWPAVHRAVLRPCSSHPC